MEYSAYTEDRDPATDLVAIKIPVSKNETTVVYVDTDLLNPYRGDWSETDQLPSSGGRFTDGAPMRGDKWRLTDTVIIGLDTISAGTVVEAAVNDADSLVISDWNIYAMQS